MRAQLLGENQEAAPVRGTTDGLQTLVQKFIGQVKNSTPKPDGEAPEVILDMEADGVRCILIRLPPKSPHTQVMLSPREREIVRMVAEGYPNKTIAAVLDISSWTVGTYLRRVFAKLGVGSRAAMVARMLEGGSMVEQPRHRDLSTLRRKYRFDVVPTKKGD